MLSHGIGTDTPTTEELTTDHKIHSHRAQKQATDTLSMLIVMHYHRLTTTGQRAHHTEGCTLIVQAASNTDHYTLPSTPTTEQGTHHRGMLSHGISTDTPF